MHWAEVLAIIGANIAMISWLKSDMKTFESRIDSKLDKWHDDIQKEMKDFHGLRRSIPQRVCGRPRR